MSEIFQYVISKQLAWDFKKIQNLSLVKSRLEWFISLAISSSNGIRIARTELIFMLWFNKRFKWSCKGYQLGVVRFKSTKKRTRRLKWVNK